MNEAIKRILHDFAAVPVRAALDPDLGAAALRVLILLTAHVDKNGKCFPSQGTLGRQLGISRQAVGQHIQKLKERDYIRSTRQNRGNGSETSCLYQIVYAEPLQGDLAPPQVDLAGENSSCTPLQALDIAPSASSGTCTHNIPIEQTNNNGDPARSACTYFSLPEWINPNDWKDFEEMRRKKHKPMTNRARLLAVNSLDQLMTQGYQPAAVIQQSILNGWSGFFPIKGQSAKADNEEKLWKSPF